MKTLQDLIAQSIDDVVDLQELYNTHYEQELLRIGTVISQQPEIPATVLPALIPSRMMVSQYEFSCQLHLEQDRSRQFELDVKVLPLNVGLLVGKKSTQQQHITISIEQSPLQNNPLSKLK